MKVERKDFESQFNNYATELFPEWKTDWDLYVNNITKHSKENFGMKLIWKPGLHGGKSTLYYADIIDKEKYIMFLLRWA